jgi:hypothetical protein
VNVLNLDQCLVNVQISDDQEILLDRYTETCTVYKIGYDLYGMLNRFHHPLFSWCLLTSLVAMATAQVVLEKQERRFK